VIRVLRPIGGSTLVSGRAFEHAFARSLHPSISVESVALEAWLDSVAPVDPIRPEALPDARPFRAATDGYDFLCPDHGAIPLSPLLLELRNRSRAQIRLLFIAHAPGAYALEWALLRPLVRPGDVIVAPTRSAADVIAFLCPELAAYTRVVPHPIRPLPRCGSKRTDVVSLVRLHPDKLLHRQIEAMGILRDRRVADVTMKIAGPLSAACTSDESSYVRSLKAKVRRLGLADRVELVPEIDGPIAKSRFLARARLLVNLSVTLEESFGKSVAEALGCGIPVLATRWNGLPETVGNGGLCVPVETTSFGTDVSAERIADAMAALLQSPPNQQTCRTEALRFHPRRVRTLYRHVLELARQMEPARGATSTDLAGAPAAPEAGLLSVTAPLTELAWDELFAWHIRDVASHRQSITRPGIGVGASADAVDCRMLLLFGIQAPLHRFLAGVPLEGKDRPVHSGATLNSRLTCLSFLASTGKNVALRSGVDALRHEGLSSWGIDFMEIEALRLEKRYAEAFRLSIEESEPLAWGELASERLRQLARVCREWGFPGLALPRLRDWLERFPDGPDSAMVHADRAANAGALGADFRTEATGALAAARSLLDQSVDLSGIQQMLDAVDAPAPPWSAVAATVGALLSTEQVGRSTFRATTSSGQFVVKRIDGWHSADGYLECLARVSRNTSWCPRPIATVRDSAERPYVIGEWIDDLGSSDDAEREWPAMLDLLQQLRSHSVVPGSRLEPRWLTRLGQTLTDEPAALLLLDALRQSPPTGSCTLAHGDFSPQNIVRGAGGYVLIDWEEVGSAADGFDAGWLLAHARLGAGLRSYGQTKTALLAAGFDERNLSWFESLGLVRLLFRARTLSMDDERRRVVVARTREAVASAAETMVDVRAAADGAVECFSPS